MASQLLALVVIFLAVGTAAYVELVNIGVIYSWQVARSVLPFIHLTVFRLIANAGR